MKLVDFAIARPVTVAMLLLSMVLLGWISFYKLPQDLYPDIAPTQLTIVTRYPKAAPEEVETLITRPIEEALSTTSRMKKLYSLSQEGTSFVTVTFHWGAQIELASLEVREKLDLIKDKLPKEAELPVVKKINPYQLPLMILSLSSDQKSSWDLKQWGEIHLKEGLQKIEGVAAVHFVGADDREIFVDVDPDKMQHQGIDLRQVIQAIKEDNINYPAGSTKEEFYELVIRTLAETKSAQEIGEVKIPLPQSPLNAISLNQIASVYLGDKEKESAFRINGKEAISCVLYAQSKANLVETAKAVKARLKQIQSLLPQGTDLDVVYDKSAFIQDSIHGVLETAVVGGILSFGVLWFFLRSIRLSLTVFLTLPLSVFFTLTLMYLKGINLNMISLAGIALSLGMLIDNSIVILENIFRYLKMNHPPKEAARLGTQEVMAPLLSSTLTSIAVFLPMIFLNGLEAQLFSDLAYTVIFGLTNSLFISFIFLPCWIAYDKKIKETDFQENRFFDKIQEKYLKIFTYCQAKPKKVFKRLGMAFLFCLMLMLFLPRQLMPDIDQREFWIDLSMPPGTRFDLLLETVKVVETACLKNKKVKKVVAQLGEEEDQESASIVSLKKHQARLLVLTQTSKRGETDAIQQRLENEIRKIFNDQKVNFNFYKKDPFLTEQKQETKGIILVVRGTLLDSIEQKALELKKEISQWKQVEAILVSLPEPSPEIQIKINKDRGALVGLSAEEIALVSQAALKGVVATSIYQEDEKVSVRVRLDPEIQSHPESLGAIEILSPQGMRIPLEELAEIKRGEGVSEVERLDGQKVYFVNVIPKSGKKNSLEKRLKRYLKKENALDTIKVEFSGEVEERKKSFRNVLAAFLLSLILIYMIMAAQFESLTEPFLILITVPFALLGVAPALFLTGTPIGLMVFLGLILLGGIVVNNGIVLIQFIHDLKKEGMATKEASLQAGLTRLRPILMTMATTVLGMVPFLFEGGLSTQLQMPLALTLSAGLLVSTLITVVVIPLVYSGWGRRREAKDERV